MNRSATALRRLTPVVGVVAMLTLASCGASFEVTAGASGPVAVTATPTATASPTGIASPTVTVAPTATPTPAPTASPTPDTTATATAGLVAEWSANAQQLLNIDSALGSIGTRFQQGTLSRTDGGNQLRQLDQQAAAVATAFDRLDPLPGADAAALSHYHQSVDQWAAAIHDVDVKVQSNDIFGTPGAVNHLEQLGNDLEQQTANLGLPRHS